MLWRNMNPTVGIVASPAEKAQIASKFVKDSFNTVTEDNFDDADVIVVLGGDGTMLQAIHAHMGRNIPFYGVNCGSVGFLMNETRSLSADINSKIQNAVVTEINPIRVEYWTDSGESSQLLAINDISLMRQSSQAAKLRISVNSEVKLEELIGDGLIVSTPVGSTAYNRSAGGPILPLEAPLLAITPICAFRPRYWKGAIVPDSLGIEVEVLEEAHRHVMLAADSTEVRDIVRVRVELATDKKFRILSDPGRSWSDKLLNEQFYG